MLTTNVNTSPGGQTAFSNTSVCTTLRALAWTSNVNTVMQALEAPDAHYDVDADTEGCLNSEAPFLTCLRLKNFRAIWLDIEVKWKRTEKKPNYLSNQRFFLNTTMLSLTVLSVYILTHILYSSK